MRRGLGVCLDLKVSSWRLRSGQVGGWSHEVRSEYRRWERDCASADGAWPGGMEGEQPVVPRSMLGTSRRSEEISAVSSAVLASSSDVSELDAGERSTRGGFGMSS